MTWSEALDILNLSGSPTEDEAKRAYLRLTKKFRPERDPDGFIRIRTAYETLSGQSGADSGYTRIYRQESETPPVKEIPEYYHDNDLCLLLENGQGDPRQVWVQTLQALSAPFPSPHMIMGAMKLVWRLFGQGHTNEARQLVDILQYLMAADESLVLIKNDLNARWIFTLDVQAMAEQLPTALLGALVEFEFTEKVDHYNIKQALLELPVAVFDRLEERIYDLAVISTGLTQSLYHAMTEVKPVVEWRRTLDHDRQQEMAREALRRQHEARQAGQGQTSNQGQTAGQTGNEEPQPRQRRRFHENYNRRMETGWTPEPEPEQPRPRPGAAGDFYIDLDAIEAAAKPIIDQADRFLRDLFGGKH